MESFSYLEIVLSFSFGFVIHRAKRLEGVKIIPVAREVYYVLGEHNATRYLLCN